MLSSGTSAGKAGEALLFALRSYGIQQTLFEETLGSLTEDEAHSDHEDVILLKVSPDVSKLVLRRLTLSFKRLPSRMTVWEDECRRHLIAARVPWVSLNRLRHQHPESSLEGVLHSLHQGDPSLASYTIQQFANTDALRLGVVCV